MKKINFLLALFLLFASSLIAQSVGIGTSSPASSAKLDISDANRGLLIPRVALVQTSDGTSPIAAPATSLLVYNTATVNDVSPGYYYWNGTAWTKLLSSIGAAWELGGNAGTDPNSNFVGTTDSQPLRFKINNLPGGIIDSTTRNSFYGFKAGAAYDLSSLAASAAFGYKALSKSTAIYNTAIGAASMLNTTSGSGNTAIGYNSLNQNTLGEYNTALGTGTLFWNTSGSFNTAVGINASTYNATGAYNVSLGNAALAGNQDGSYNVAIGALALSSATSTSDNVAVGAYSLNANTTGWGNVGLGTSTLRNNTIGHGNTAIGDDALITNQTGNDNVAVGWRTLYYNSTGGRNVAVGHASMQFNSTGYSNTALGYSSLQNNGNGWANVAVGDLALGANYDGIGSTGIGYLTLRQNNANDNTAIGNQAMIANITGWSNTAVGAFAGASLVSGAYNTMLGRDAGYYVTGSGNVGVGYGSLRESFGGDNNTSVGANSGSNIIGNYTIQNTALGYNARWGFVNYGTAIGYNSLCGANNSVVVGNALISSIGGYANWSNYSDVRFKRNIRENVKGIEFINALRPVTYNLDVAALNNHIGVNPYGSDSLALANPQHKAAIDAQIAQKEAIQMSGFIAQEVEAAAREIAYDFDGVIKPSNEQDHYRISYASFVVPLVKAAQELSAKSDAQQAEIEKLQAQIAKMQAELEKMSKTKE